MARKRYLTPPELADYLNIPLETINYWRKRKRGPRSTKFEGSVRYALTEVEKYEADPEEYQRQRDLEVRL
jgi:Helix-turn-helix domain